MSLEAAKKAKRSKCIRKPAELEQKTTKKLRNRVFAQASRDRKRQELEDLREEAARLRTENQHLQDQLRTANSELERLNRIVGAPSKPAVSEVPSPIQADKKKPSRVARCKVILATVFLGCLCFAACVSSLTMKIYRPEWLAPTNLFAHGLGMRLALYTFLFSGQKFDIHVPSPHAYAPASVPFPYLSPSLYALPSPELPLFSTSGDESKYQGKDQLSIQSPMHDDSECGFLPGECSPRSTVSDFRCFPAVEEVPLEGSVCGGALENPWRDSTDFPQDPDNCY